MTTNGWTPIHPTMGLQSVDYLGLTKREYFAGQAMIGILSGWDVGDTELIASTAVKMADALLEKLEDK